MRKEHELLHEASEKLSTSVENLPTMVGNIQTELREVTRQRNEARTEMLLQGAEAMYENAPLREDGIRVICRQISGDMDGARALAADLTGPGICRGGAGGGRRPADAICGEPQSGSKPGLAARPFLRRPGPPAARAADEATLLRARGRRKCWGIEGGHVEW